MSGMRGVRQRIMRWVWDGKPEWLTERLWVWNVGRVLCWFAGHRPVCDIHHRPERDHCGYCNKAMPGKAHR